MAAVANASATIKSGFFHPQHPLTRYHYSEASTYPCAACERVVTGTGYRCDECNFNIHEACLGLPGSINFGQHREHELTLGRLGASRGCNVCRETSPAGCYMYHCSPCNYDVHPRCIFLLTRGRESNGALKATLKAVKVTLKIGMFGLKVANVFTGGLLSPLLHPIDYAIGNM
ncbi:hypothetical protein EJB05_11343, partial [Eragrostis curvula]